MSTCFLVDTECWLRRREEAWQSNVVTVTQSNIVVVATDYSPLTSTTPGPGLLCKFEICFHYEHPLSEQCRPPTGLQDSSTNLKNFLMISISESGHSEEELRSF